MENESLIPWVKFIWRFETENASVCHKLLPTDSIDLVINLSDEIIYETDDYKIIAPSFHINGLRDTYSYIHQTGNIRVWGISFHSFGLFPFIHHSIISARNKIADLQALSIPLAQKLKAVFSDDMTESTIISIEKALCSELRIEDDYVYKADLMRDFTAADDNVTIQSFCNERGINIKTFERMVLRSEEHTS
jgi:hypothetical protein